MLIWTAEAIRQDAGPFETEPSFERGRSQSPQISVYGKCAPQWDTFAQFELAQRRRYIRKLKGGGG